MRLIAPRATRSRGCATRGSSSPGRVRGCTRSRRAARTTVQPARAVPPARTAAVEDDPAEQERPVRERVQARERHVARADHQRHEVVAEAGEDRDDDEEDHRRAVHRHRAVVGVLRQEMLVRRRELRAHEQRQRCRRPRRTRATSDVEDPDPLVVDGREPARDRPCFQVTGYRFRSSRHSPPPPCRRAAFSTPTSAFIWAAVQVSPTAGIFPRPLRTIARGRPRCVMHRVRRRAPARSRPCPHSVALRADSLRTPPCRARTSPLSSSHAAYSASDVSRSRSRASPRGRCRRTPRTARCRCRPVGLEPRVVRVAGDRLVLPPSWGSTSWGRHRRPRRVSSITLRRDVQVVDRAGAVRVIELPVELMALDDDLQRVRFEAGTLAIAGELDEDEARR